MRPDTGIGPVWDRTAEADLWLRTLSEIPSTFGRMAYLASLRDANSDRYEHDGLAALFGADEVHRALCENHERAFAQWLSYTLEQQKADLDLYLSSLDTPRRTLLQSWKRLAPYKNLIPSSAGLPERNLYMLDIEITLEILRNELVAQAPLRRQSLGR